MRIGDRFKTADGNVWIVLAFETTCDFPNRVRQVVLVMYLAGEPITWRVSDFVLAEMERA